MPFVENIRQWHLRAQEFCQTLIYGEENGYQPCGSTEKLEVDHLDPESQLIEQGKNPNASDAIVRCQSHHTGEGVQRDDDGSLHTASYGESQWSRHPDMYEARVKYRQGDKNAFKNASAKHHEAAKKGERITNDDWGVTEHERERIRNLEAKYAREHPEDKRPEPKERKKKEIPANDVIYNYDEYGNQI